ncbi:copper amine oxidase [Lasiosphaeris hirsuta]|uniref:Copper amine oxidase n=1 Tax=Lasiosphaeris hirsuta TaxID=260670 RepID=A0AA40B033_9PEZI|nr:copper amine oxidase [Lasiosphaeris hirsuta]
MFDYAFHVDGLLESNFGPRIYKDAQGSYHDHILTFKADFNILDTKNSLQVTKLLTANQTQPWYPELVVFEQMELQTSNLEKEEQFNWADNG